MLSRNHKLIVVDWALALFVGALFVSPVLAAEKRAKLVTGEKAILAALEEKTTFDFIDEPICGVADFIRKTHGIAIQIDMTALEDVNIGADTPISKRLDGITLRSALNLILRDLDLTWVIKDEVLVITTPEEAELQLTTRIYDVRGLVTVQDPEGKLWQDFDSLIRVLTKTVEPESWEDVGGPGSIAELEVRGAVVLVVRQTIDIHEQIGKIIEELTKIAGKYGDDIIPTREKPKQRRPSPIGAFGGGMSGMGSMGGSGGGGGGMM